MYAALSQLAKTLIEKRGHASDNDLTAFQKQKRTDLEWHRETRFDVDDRQIYSLARDLASSHGYTVLHRLFRSAGR
jgi:hypothetical protein